MDTPGVVFSNMHVNVAEVILLDPLARGLEAIGTTALINFAVNAVNTAFPDATSQLSPMRPRPRLRLPKIPVTG
ncbi:MAG: hypothetical protein ACLQAT_19925 [Candidatus Binataceae bacterium]